MVLQSQSGIQRIQEQFDELCQNILAEELTDNGRCLRRKGLHTMKLHLSPMETRHETAIRVIVAQIGAIGIRIKRLEKELAGANEEPEGPIATAIGADPNHPEADPLPTDTEQMFVDALETAEKPLTEE